MSGINENHTRRILASLQYADRLMDESVSLLSSSSHSPFSKYEQDLSAAESHWIESYALRVREQMSQLLQRFDIQPPQSKILASWSIQTNLVALDIALEDLFPEQMRGYGEMDAETARALTWTLHEIKRLVSQLMAYLKRTRGEYGQRLADLDIGSTPKERLERLLEIIHRHRLVEFIPALDSTIRKVEAPRLEIAVFGRVSSGKSSLINRLLEIDLLPVGAIPITAVPIHILSGPALHLRVGVAGRDVQEMPVQRLHEFATEQENPGNIKRVVMLEVLVPSTRLQDGVAFVDTPGIASIATSGTELSLAYLPNCDLGIVLVDASSPLGREDLDLVRALHVAGIPPVILISKCDLMAEREIESVLSYTQRVLKEQLGFDLEITPVSSVDSWTARLDAWFQQTIWPLSQRAKQSLAASVQRKVQFLQDSLLVALETHSGQLSSSRGRNNLEGNLVETLLRPFDEMIQGFKGRWEECFEGISGWTERLLEITALKLAEDETRSSGGDRLSSVISEELDQYCQAFLREYIDLESQILDAIRQMQAETSKAEIWYEPPRTPALPAPVLDALEKLSLDSPGRVARLSHSGRVNFFRKQLDERARASVQEVLNEYRPRLTRWFRATVALLEQSYRIQTDPYRYLASSSDLVAPKRPIDLVNEDLTYLRSERTHEREPDRSPATQP